MKDKDKEPKSDLTESASDTIGAPPPDSTITTAPPVIDTVDAAVTVTTGMANLAGSAMGVGPAFTEAEDDKVTADQIDKQALPSAAYGDFVKQVGLAVAEAQKALDDNSVEATIKLSKTTIPALIAMNQVVDENGEILSIKPVIQPDSALIQYIQPTFYQWSSVTLFATFRVSAFDAKGQTVIESSRSGSASTTSAGGGLGFGPGGFSARVGGSGGRSSSSSQSSTEVDTAFESAQSTGQSSMLAVLEPRTDTRFPPPIIATQGPRLSISSNSNSLALPADPAGPAPQAKLEISLIKRDSDFLESDVKLVDVKLEGPGELVGSIPVNLTRGKTPGSDPKRLVGSVDLKRVDRTSVGDATVRVSLGILSSSVTLSFPPAPPPPK